MKLNRTYYKPPRIVHPGSTGRRLAALALLILLGIVVWQAYEYGREIGGYEHKAAARVERQLREQLAETEATRDQLEARVARLEAAVKIDKASVRQVRGEISELQTRNLKLTKELDFYKGLARDSSYRGIQVRDFSLEKQGGGGLRYRLDIVQLKAGAKKLTGRLRMELVGSDAKGEPVKLNGPQPRLSLKNLQEMSGKVVLPKGFVPERLNLYVYLAGAKKPALAETFDWSALLAGD